MIRKEQQKSGGSPNVRIGEIDTSAPFQSVKDAVNLFVESASSAEKPPIKKVKPHSAERLLFAKDTQIHLAEKELKKLKERLSNAENTKAEALIELEKARQTEEDLNQKLKTINEVKAAALKATEAAKLQAKQLEEANHGNLVLNNAFLNQDLESAREQYMSALEELSSAKQELAKIRQDYNASLEANASAVNQVEEAEIAAKANTERAQELSKEISAVNETIDQVHQATTKAKQDQTKVFEEKDVERQTYTGNFEESAKLLHAIRRDFDPELIKHLENQIAEKLSEVNTLQKEIDGAKALDVETLRSVTSEVESAKESLQKVVEEESVLHKLVDSLKCELETLRKEHAELREKEAEIESVAGNLHVKLRKSKSDLEIFLTHETKAGGALEEMIVTLSQISTEKESARQEAENLKTKTEELEKEAEASRASLQEAEKLLKTALEEADQAEAAEESALEQIKIISERTNTARSSTSESGAKITLSRDEYESLSRKAGESDKLTVLKVAAAMAQVEAVKASENEALKKLESAQKEVEDIKAATEGALKTAEMAEAAKKAIEGELRRWREREQKKAAEIAYRIMEETKAAQAQAQTEGTADRDTAHQVSAKKSPIHPKLQKQKPELPIVTKKLEKRQTSLSKKTLKPSLSGIFHRKKSQIDDGSPA